MCFVLSFRCFFFFKQKTAYEMRISDWSSDVCSSDLSRESEGVGRELFMNDVPAAGVRGAAGGLRGAWPATGKLARHPPRVSPAPPAGCAGNFNLSSRFSVGKFSVGRISPCDASSSRSEEHTSELQSLMRLSYAVFFLKK